MNETVSDLPWHVIHGDELVNMLQEAIDCGDAGLVYLEHYANTEVPPPSDGPDGWKNEAKVFRATRRWQAQQEGPAKDDDADGDVDEGEK